MANLYFKHSSASILRFVTTIKWEHATFLINTYESVSAPATASIML